jgi:hypothetical protein
MDTSADDRRRMSDNLDGHPIADVCSLCGQGYFPTMEIDIAHEPTNGEYRWCHVQCNRDHGRKFLEASDE